MFWIVILQLKISWNLFYTINVKLPLKIEILYHLNETNKTFFFPSLFTFFWLFFVKLLICFRILKDTFFSLNLPTTQSKMWILSSFSCLFSTSTWSMTPFPYPFKYRRDSSVFSHPYSLLLITTPSTFAWYPRDWYACLVSLSLPGYHFLGRKATACPFCRLMDK